MASLRLVSTLRNKTQAFEPVFLLHPPSFRWVHKPIVFGLPFRRQVVAYKVQPFGLGENVSASLLLNREAYETCRYGP